MTNLLPLPTLKAAVLVAITLLGIAAGWGVALAMNGVLHPEAADAATTLDAHADPFAYCASAGTVDAPEQRAVGTGVHPAIAAALHAQGVAVESVRWRCMEGKVYACGVADQRTGGNQDIRRFCQQQPNAPSVPAGVAGHRTLYHWRCEGSEPAIVQQVAHADERGFVAEYWRLIPNP